MINCTKKNIWYKKRRKSYKFFIITLLILSVLIGAYFYYKKIVCNQIFNICSSYMYACSTDCINTAVLISLDGNIKYSDLIYVDKNDSGEITLISTNAYKINKINREVSDTSTKLIQKRIEKGIPIPALAFTGISFLSGYGEKINLLTINNVSVVCDFVSTFKSVGVNQTLHSIYIEIESKIEIKVPLNNKEEKTKTKILIAETILIGKVPEFYLNGGLNP